jgi:predicted DNA-binding transcriptional regulator YafY
MTNRAKSSNNAQEHPQGFATKFRTRWRHVLLIDERIRSGESPNCQQLAGELEVSRRTILRDVEFLKDDLGAPIEYDASKRGYVYTEPNWSMPNLRITEGELFALMVAEQALEAYAGTSWGEALKRVFDRMVAALPDRIEIAPRELLPRFSLDTTPMASVNPDVMSVLTEAVKKNRTIVITYHPLQKKDAREYVVDPYILRQSHGAWYLAARDHRSGHVPMFNVSRMLAASTTGGEFDYEAADFDSKAYFEETFGVYETPKRYKVVVRLSGVAARLVSERQWHPSQKLRYIRSGDIELEMVVSHLDDIWPWVLSWGKNAKVMQPKALRDTVVKQAKQIQATHENR